MAKLERRDSSVGEDKEEARDVAVSDQRLQDLGYKSEFRREMSLFKVLGISFCAIGILTGMSSAFQTGLFSGGPVGLFWGWNICSFFMFLIALSLAEICSTYPTMGGLYFWVCKMKPDIPILGFFTGWLYSMAMVFTGIAGNLTVALYLASMAEVGQGRTLTRVEITAIAWAMNIFSGIVNTIGTKAIGQMSMFNVWWTLGGTLNSPDFVFTNFQNFTGWESRGFVVLLGFLQAVYTLEGCETAAQVAEEAVRAEILAPLAVAGSIAGSWLIGLAYMLSLLFAVQNIASVQATTYAIPISQLFYDAVGPQLAQLCLVVVMLSQVMAAITNFTASSRLFYALARDNAFPLKKQFMTLNRFQAPYWGVWTSVLIGCIISCAYIGSAVAFDAMLSSAAISVMLSYLQPIIIRVFWPDSIEDFGPFCLGKWSWPVNVAGFSFCVFVCILFVLPTAYPANVLNMNYAIVAVGGLLVIITINWFWWGKHSFKGPVKTLTTFK
ncbi:amino acid transporter [Suillus subaureus]|uniref:Amino acid transporter n=1 Tax=Suillus subaureus TaxID=48587 RepID=A0A9P7EE45_9AGAM|nr:amino acid transporter [Suillus subaureus]KAG1819222.1 amino acid transporter [Suillus subaureus]